MYSTVIFYFFFAEFFMLIKFFQSKKPMVASKNRVHSSLNVNTADLQWLVVVCLLSLVFTLVILYMYNETELDKTTTTVMLVPSFLFYA